VDFVRLPPGARSFRYDLLNERIQYFSSVNRGSWKIEQGRIGQLIEATAPRVGDPLKGAWRRGCAERAIWLRRSSRFLPQLLPVARLDRAFSYEPEDRVFESLRAHPEIHGSDAAVYQ
jgi:hypothetical protein